MKDLKTLDFNEINEIIKNIKEPAYRAGQLYKWLHIKHVLSFDEMNNIPLDLKQKLSKDYYISGLKEVLFKESPIDGTRKYLFKLDDNNIIESVFMRYKHGNSVCISSQVGCKMGCTFCASTLGGLVRNLTNAEMLAQVYAITESVGERISNIVIMGAGEPMDNYENVVSFVKMISDEQGVNISRRNITISTCGIVPQMKRLADDKLAVTLALSLHAPDNETRKKLMPIARAYNIDEVLAACDYYFKKTGRRVSFEYALVAGVNDSSQEAQKLIKLIKHSKAHVNLIPVNPIEERSYRQSDKKRVEAFKNQLLKAGINATIRREMGRDIDGACGQLRRHYEAENSEI